jgi:UDP-glucose:(heptosyl)LPS alpha-1,3-glucosyltransferase
VRLAIIRQRYNPFGGAERFVERAAAALGAQGASISIIARAWDGTPESSRAVQWLRCDPRYLGRRARDASFARAACALVERERFDLVQSHERIACCDIYRAGDGVHRQWLDYRARAGSALVRLALQASPYHRYVLAAERALFASKRLRAVICNSRMVRDDIRRHFALAEDKLHVIYNGVDIERFHPDLCAVHRDAQRRALRIAHDEFVYVFVGSGFKRKGVPQLLAAFAQLPQRQSARLVIVGKDRHEARMKGAAARLGIADRVVLAGPQRDVAPWYAMADAFVLPTLYDPFPNAALEALACGLPTITTNQCGAAELIERGRNGFICNALDVAGLADAMHALRDLPPADARAAARAAAEGLSLSAMAERLIALYRALALA